MVCRLVWFGSDQTKQLTTPPPSATSSRGSCFFPRYMCTRESYDSQNRVSDVNLTVLVMRTCRYCTGTAVLTVLYFQSSAGDLRVQLFCSVELGVSSPFDDAGFVPVLYWKSVPRQCVSRILCKCIWGGIGRTLQDLSYLLGYESSWSYRIPST